MPFYGKHGMSVCNNHHVAVYEYNGLINVVNKIGMLLSATLVLYMSYIEGLVQKT